MELYKFIKLNIDERAETLWNNGTFILNLKEDNYSYNLYSFFGYYIEVKLSNYGNEIVDIKPFRKGECLNKYLDFIDIS
jgi:hypothetical protein